MRKNIQCLLDICSEREGKRPKACKKCTENANCYSIRNIVMEEKLKGYDGTPLYLTNLRVRIIRKAILIRKLKKI